MTRTMHERELAVDTLRAAGRGYEAAQYAREHGCRDPKSGLHGRFNPTEKEAGDRARDRCTREGKHDAETFGRYYAEEKLGEHAAMFDQGDLVSRILRHLKATSASGLADELTMLIKNGAGS